MSLPQSPCRGRWVMRSCQCPWERDILEPVRDSMKPPKIRSPASQLTSTKTPLPVTFRTSPAKPLCENQVRQWLNAYQGYQNLKGNLNRCMESTHGSSTVADTVPLPRILKQSGIPVPVALPGSFGGGVRFCVWKLGARSPPSRCQCLKTKRGSHWWEMLND